ncbi:hypothetical protein Q3G72_034865 [Acer saccharum]|nr:hypothetical protein Q3G72_034865 [Acer saccharum]
MTKTVAPPPAALPLCHHRVYLESIDLHPGCRSSRRQATLILYSIRNVSNSLRKFSKISNLERFRIPNWMQQTSCRMVKELGLAVEMRLDSKVGDLVMAEEIARAVRCVMDGDSEVRKKVKEMSEISRKSLMDGGSSFISIRKFIDLNF